MYVGMHVSTNVVIATTESKPHQFHIKPPKEHCVGKSLWYTGQNHVQQNKQLYSLAQSPGGVLQDSSCPSATTRTSKCKISFDEKCAGLNINVSISNNEKSSKAY